MVAKLHKNIPWFQGDVKTFGNCIVTKKHWVLEKLHKKRRWLQGAIKTLGGCKVT